jgi:transposase InsO family protein
LVRGIPEHIRSDNGPEFIAEELRKWLGKVGTRTLYIEPGCPTRSEPACSFYFLTSKKLAAGFKCA